MKDLPKDLGLTEMVCDLALFSAWFVTHPELHRETFEKIDAAYEKYLRQLAASLLQRN